MTALVHWFLNGIRHYLLAVQFFTRIPVTGSLANWVGFSQGALRASAAHFPGVGWLVGALMAMCWWLGHHVLPVLSGSAWVAAWLVVAMGVWTTGGFHEDGLADLTDGLGGSYNRQRALEIMKDSRIGSFGALALVLGLFGRVVLLVALAEVSWSLAGLALWLAQVVSRTWPLALIRTLTHVGEADGSKSKPLADQISNAAMWVGLLWLGTAVLTVQWAWPAGGWWLAMAVSAASAWWMRSLLLRRLQGFTGDGLGATQQVSELAFYLGLLVAVRLGLVGSAAVVAN